MERFLRRMKRSMAVYMRWRASPIMSDLTWVSLYGASDYPVEP